MSNDKWRDPLAIVHSPELRPRHMTEAERKLSERQHAVIQREWRDRQRQAQKRAESDYNPYSAEKFYE